MDEPKVKLTSWNMLLLLSWLWLGVVSTAPVLCPEMCTCTWTFTNCSDTNIQTVPTDIDENVEILDLSFNSLNSIAIPEELVHLKEINLSGCGVSSASFPGLSNLEKIDLSNNEINDLSLVNFREVSGLKILNLANNKRIKSLNFLDSSSLEELDVSDCHLNAFPIGLNLLLPRLKKFALRNHSLRTLMYLESKTLVELDASHGELVFITAEKLKKLPHLLYLNVSYNPNLRFTLMDEECLHLENIDLSGTGMSEISVDSLCYLEDANFSFNSITRINENTFINNIYLKSLNLSINNIEHIHKNAFGNVTMLKQLDLTRNMLRDAAWTTHLTDLKFLNLSQNELRELKDISLYSVLMLDVSENHIYSLDINLRDTMPNIEYLDLSYNMISILQPMKSASLKTLKLSYCQITSLTQTVFIELKNLMFLDLEGNKLARLDYEVLLRASNLKDVHLCNNPWNCNCRNERLHSLYTYLVVNQTITNPNDLICDEPSRRTWFEACSDSWTRNRRSSSSPTFAIVVGFFVISLIGLGALIYFRHRSKRHAEERPSANSTSTDHRQTYDIGIRRVHSAGDVMSRATVNSAADLPPPSYEEALLLPTLSEVERMTRSMDVLAHHGYR